MALGTVSKAEDACYIWGIDVPGDDIRWVTVNSLSQCRFKCSEEERSVRRFS